MTTTKLSLMKRLGQFSGKELFPIVTDGKTLAGEVSDLVDYIGPRIPIADEVRQLADQAAASSDAAGGSARAASDAAENAAASTAAIGSGSSADAGNLTGDDIFPLSRRLGLLQTSLATIAEFLLAGFSGFQLTGTGVLRTLLAKLFDMPVMPEDFGAKGDGVTDDTVPVKKAIVFAMVNGLHVHFKRSHYINDVISIGSGNVSWDGGGVAPIILGPNGGFVFTDDQTNIHWDKVVFYSKSHIPIADFQGTGGQYHLIRGCKFLSGNESTSEMLIKVVGAYGSQTDCEYNAGTGNQDVVQILASSANYSFDNPSSYGQQSRSFCYADGSATAFGVQGIKVNGGTLLNFNNGLIAKHNIDNFQVNGAMVDSMDVPIEFDGVMHGSITGGYIGGNSATKSPINLTNCTNFSMVGVTGEAYGNHFAVSPPPRMVYVSGGSDHSYIGNRGKLDGNSYFFSGTLPPNTTVLGNTGAGHAIDASPPQFSADTSVSTTEWVASAGRMFAQQTIMTGTASIPASAAGTLIFAVLNADATFTLPSVNIGPGFRVSLYIYNWSANTLTLTAAAGESVRTANPKLLKDQWIELVNNQGSSSWIVINRGSA